MTVLPAMPPEQTASWWGLLDFHELLTDAWTLIGGQPVPLHCAEPRQFAVRPTNDADTVIDVRGTQALQRRETVRLSVAGREGSVRRPTLVGAQELTKKDRQRLRAMVGAARKDRALLLEVPDAESSLARLAAAGEL